MDFSPQTGSRRASAINRLSQGLLGRLAKGAPVEAGELAHVAEATADRNLRHCRGGWIRPEESLLRPPQPHQPEKRHRGHPAETLKTVLQASGAHPGLR